jgi:DNA-binding Lrp family transcriptional regulator
MIESANLRELGRFVAEKLATINGVTGTTTNFVLRRYKEDQVMFIDTEEDQRLVVSP